jgi:hypothetical protein
MELLHTQSLHWDLSQLYTTGEETLAAATSLLGDYNLDGIVDAADYIVWRKSGGTPAAYNTWRSNFGRTAGSGSGATAGRRSAVADLPSSAVPEPAALSLLLFAAALLYLLRWSPGHTFFDRRTPCLPFSLSPPLPQGGQKSLLKSPRECATLEPRQSLDSFIGN